MLTQFRTLKRALRFYASEEHPCALLELNAIADQTSDSRLIFCVRGRVKQAMKRYSDAITDYMRALSPSMVGTLNQRNTRRVVQNVVDCSLKLTVGQADSLQTILRDDFSVAYDQWFPSGLKSAAFASQQQARKTSQSKTKAAVGKIANLGKFLLDARDIQKIGQLVTTEQQTTGTRRFTTYPRYFLESAGNAPSQLAVLENAQQKKEQLIQMLRNFDLLPGVIGSCLIGTNGIPIDSTLPAEYDAELIGLYSLGMYMHTVTTNELLGYDGLPAMILRSNKGCSVIVNCRIAFLISLTEGDDALLLSNVLKEIWSVRWQ